MKKTSSGILLYFNRLRQASAKPLTTNLPCTIRVALEVTSRRNSKMKSVLLALAALTSVSVFAAEIKGGRFNYEKNAIELDIAHGGRCGKHSFSLRIGSVLESYPVQCPEVQLIEDTNDDQCDAWVEETIFFPLESVGLNDSYYSGARLTIHGDAIHGDEQSKVSITLPTQQ